MKTLKRKENPIKSCSFSLKKRERKGKASKNSMEGRRSQQVSQKIII